MKIFIFFAVLLMSTSSYAVKVISVENASNQVELNGDYQPVFMAGISGRAACSNETTTINTCHLFSDRYSCNFSTVCPTTRLRLEVLTKQSGSLALADISGQPLYKLGKVEAGKNTIVEIPWSEICFGLASDRDCSTISRGALRFTVNQQGHNSPVETSSFIFQVSGIPNTSYVNNKTVSLAEYDGVENYTLVPGDKKAFLTDLSVLNGFYFGEAARITGLRAFFAPANCSQVLAVPETVNTGSDSYILKLSEDQSSIETSIIEGLTNNQRYTFMIGFEDEAGNIGLFKDLGKQCIDDVHSVVPQSVQ